MVKKMPLDLMVMWCNCSRLLYFYRHYLVIKMCYLVCVTHLLALVSQELCLCVSLFPYPKPHDRLFQGNSDSVRFCLNFLKWRSEFETVTGRSPQKLQDKDRLHFSVEIDWKILTYIGKQRLESKDIQKKGLNSFLLSNSLRVLT